MGFSLRLRRTALVAALAAFLTGCSPAPQAEERHPLESRIVRAAAPETRVGFDRTSSESEMAGHLVAPLEALRSATVAFQVGSLDGSAGAVIGKIQDLALGRDERLFVLDGYWSHVKVVGRDGELHQVLGHRGRGPGEFVDPVAVDVDGKGRLFVFDKFGPVTEFRAAGDTLRFSREIPVVSEVLDGCLMRDRLYVHGVSGGPETIHVYSLDGDHLDSFGTVYRTKNRIVQQQISQGQLACSDAHDLVLFASSVLPELRAYDASGQLRWWLGIDDFRPIDLRGTSRGSIMRFTEDGHHTIGSLTASTEGDAALLQLAHVTRESRMQSRPPTLHTFLISLRDGAAVYVGMDLDRVGLMSPRRWFLARELPFPRITAMTTTPPFHSSQTGGAP